MFVAGAGDDVTSGLQMLSVSHNNVSEVAPTALRGLKALTHLRLDDNRVALLPAAMFADTPSLLVLSLAGNRRLDLGSVAEALAPARLPLLRLLDLSRVDTLADDGLTPSNIIFVITSAEEGGYVLVRSVCLSVRRITRKLVNGFWQNFLEG